MFTELLAAHNRIARSCLSEALPKTGPLAEPMAYACEGGKGLRGFLVIESAALFGIPPEQSRFGAAGIEAMHACSLVHDDLPCMDDDDLRRGRPTVHVKWDEATGVLVGDALQSVAFELVAHPDAGSGEVRAELARTLGRGAGGLGMVMGQALDLAAEVATDPLTLDEIIALQAGKTGALFEWSAFAGAILGEANREPLRQYGAALGQAFQIADDILDIEGDPDTVGKAVRKDQDAGKATFVSALGMDGARKRAHMLVETACDVLSQYGPKAENLREAARFAISRTN
ncbi:polyprenyl synthetase family protein [Maritimibacter sp. UBA3975]|uniref:polyprenyl synthetase family protein n=1 Tax=Maritimibacter sp. UBA3975 TaxID=1946833 RepID=UPI000C0AF76D|nr:polyprenyl synthetase family protein [Maritimibacter sp. UBA3975]MAM63290.1 farnesyl-diphosphate synthase [Maritimibacter sp.]|tara:strand:- start:55511 stop:56371 length:861 start_codon:yes stop_codon:yes gene_type:complete